MARTRRIKSDCDAFYHVMSRTTGKRFLLKDPRVKRMMVEALRISAEFSGVKIGAYVIMDDHFHLTVEVPTVETVLIELAKTMGTVPGKIPEKEVMRRLAVLKGEKRAKEIEGYVKHLRRNGHRREAEAEIDRYRLRMQDLSQFVKTFKEVFNLRYKKLIPYSGTIWGERFKSTIVENEKYFRNLREYIAHNPCRAKIVAAPEDYMWSSVGAAARGETYALKCQEYVSSLAFGVDDELEQNTGDSALAMLGFPLANARPSTSFRRLRPQENGGVDVMKRVPQIGMGKILGGRKFVTESATSFSAALYGKRCRAKQVGGWAFSSHGHGKFAA